MKTGSLSSGIGALDLAIEALGYEVVLAVRERPIPLRPGASLSRRRVGDVCEVDFEAVEALIGGGFRVSQFSDARKRKGAGNDPLLWSRARASRFGQPVVTTSSLVAPSVASTRTSRPRFVLRTS
jgi:hypothetical protein